MRDFQARLVTTQAAQAMPSPPDSISMKTDPKTGQKTVTVQTNQDNYEATVQSAMKYHQMLGGYAQQLDQMQTQLTNQEQQARNQPPWVRLATALSANLAQQKDLPGWVRGLGATAAELNPQPDEIRNRRIALLQEQAGIAEKGAAITGQTLHYQQMAQEHAATLGVQQAKETDTRINNFMKDAFKNAKDGQPMPYAEFNAKADLFGVPEDKRAALYQGHVEQAQGAIAQENRVLANKKDLEQVKANVQQKVKDELVDRQGQISKAVAGMRIDASKDFLQARFANIDERQAISREERAYQAKSEKGVEAINNMRDATAKLRQLIADNPDAVGPIEGRIPELMLTRKQAEVRAEFFTLLDATRQQISGGSRFWNPQEFQNLSPKLAAAVKTERVNLGILDALDDFSKRGAKNIVKSNPDVDWKTRAPVFGDIAEETIGKNVGGLQGPAGGSGGAGKPAAATSSDTPPVSLLKEGNDTEFKNGQVWTLRGGKPLRIK
jgi:hypothetical protein